jgi:phenylalanyl-tRNA synthetase beta chain
LFGGLETIAYNQNRKLSDLKLFEFGKTYKLNRTAPSEADPLARYDEQLELAIFLTGNKESENWNVEAKTVDFYDLKLYCEQILTKLRFDAKTIDWESFSDTLFEYGVHGKLHGKTFIRFGRLLAATTKQFDIKKPVYFAEIYWEKLLANLPSNAVKYKTVAKFPAVRRDLALVVDQSVLFADIAMIARKTETKLLQDVHIFDVYEGDKIAAGKKSYAVSFTLIDEEKTLTDKVIDKTMQKLQAALEQQLGAVLR